jgi:hypothetical protein
MHWRMYYCLPWTVTVVKKNVTCGPRPSLANFSENFRGTETNLVAFQFISSVIIDHFPSQQ